MGKGSVKFDSNRSRFGSFVGPFRVHNNDRNGSHFRAELVENIDENHVDRISTNSKKEGNLKMGFLMNQSQWAHIKEGKKNGKSRGI